MTIFGTGRRGKTIERREGIGRWWRRPKEGFGLEVPVGEGGKGEKG
jgi:hypothetical protein